MPDRRFVLSCLLTAALIPGARAGSSDTPDPRARVREVVPQVEAIRGLTFKAAVPVEVVDEAAVREYANRRLTRFASPADVGAATRAYELLGLVPPGTSLLEEYTSTIEESVAGYYDPEKKRFSLRRDLPDDLGAIYAAHELTHALEDQYYDLDARLERSARDDDLGFAVMAVHEGSASLLMAVYIARSIESGRMKREDLEALASVEEARGEKIRALLPALRRPLLGAYILGTRFLLRGNSGAVGTSGYPIEDVNRCYRDGPVSSEQILHPEKYWDPLRLDLPRPVTLPDAASILGPGWKRSGAGVLGELLLGTLVSVPTPETWTPESIRGEGWTNDAASGWGGDRWELWTRGGDALVLLSTVWDSDRDAREFAAALPSREGLSSKRSGNRVAVVAGKPANPIPRLLRSMLRAPAA